MLRRRGLSVSPRFLWECLTSRTVSPFPACAFYLFIRAEVGLQRAAGNSSDGPGSRISAKREATYCRDRMAPDCPIRHLVLCQNSALLK